MLGHDQMERAVRVLLTELVKVLDQMGTAERLVGNHDVPAHR
jgi:hypothetical protein